MGGDPGSAVASPHTPTESTTVASIDTGTPKASQTAWFQAEPSTSRSPFVVADAFVWSLTWSAPCDKVQATHESIVPMQRSRPSRSGVFARSQAALVADWFGASAHPCSILAMMQSPTVRRSCQPSPGPTGSPVARSHIMTLARWLVMPTAEIGSPMEAIAVRAASSSFAAMSAPSNSTNPGAGFDGGHVRYSNVRTVSVSSTTAARRPVVPTSITKMLVTCSSSPFCHDCSVKSGICGSTVRHHVPAAGFRADRRRNRRASPATA